MSTAKVLDVGSARVGHRSRQGNRREDSNGARGFRYNTHEVLPFWIE
jgi:hypothetical protein